MAAKKPTIQLFSLHGLIRSTNLEMGRDADTGGQVKYCLLYTSDADDDLYTVYISVVAV